MTGETMIGGGGGGDQAETDAGNKRPVPDNFDRMSRQHAAHGGSSGESSGGSDGAAAANV